MKTKKFSFGEVKLIFQKELIFVQQVVNLLWCYYSYKIENKYWVKNCDSQLNEMFYHFRS